MQWLVISLVLSVILTLLLNIGLRLFPDAGHRVEASLARATSVRADDARSDHRRVRVHFPWKAMLVVSVILTIVINVVLWIT